MSNKIKKCKYCGSTENLYIYPGGHILNICVNDFHQYNLDRYAKRKNKLKDQKEKEYDEKVCKYCGNSNLVTDKNGIKLSFCENCKEYHYKVRNDKAKKTLMENLGVEHPAQSPIVLKKMGDTMEDRYGKRNASQVDEFQNKKIETSRENWGTDYHLQSELLIPDRVNNWTNIYGKNGKKYNEYHEKVKNTTKENFGVENASQSEVIKEKKKKTMKKHFGVEYPFQSPILWNNIRRKQKENYWELFNERLKLKLIIPLFDKEFYINNENNLLYKCLRCNESFISDETNYQNVRCECTKNTSIAESEIENWLNSLNKNIDVKRNIWFTFNNKQKLEADIFVNNKIAIFHHGLYWHSSDWKKNNFHKTIFNLFIEKNLIPIQIFANEWMDKQDIVKSIILSKLNINQTKIYARKTIIKEIDNKSYKLFLEGNHIQGYSSAKIKLGMFYNDRLISVLGLGKSRFKTNETEIIRYCSLLNTQIIGGLAKFLAYIKNNYNFENIISYIDLRYFDGSSYLNNRFELESITKPNYYYFKNNSYLEKFILLNRIQFQKHKLKYKLEKFDNLKSEFENMLMNGYLRIFDAGNYKLRLTN